MLSISAESYSKLPFISKTVDWVKLTIISRYRVDVYRFPICLPTICPLSCLSQHLLPGFVWLAHRQENQLECQILKLDRCTCLHTIQIPLVMRPQGPQRGAQDRIPGRRCRIKTQLFTLALFKSGISDCSKRRTYSLCSNPPLFFFSRATALMVSSQIQRTNWGPASRSKMRRPRPASTVRPEFAWIVRVSVEMIVAITTPIYIFSFFSSGMYSLPTTIMHSHTNPSLEQPMGEQLMSGSDQRAPQLAITDPKVCRSYLVGNCPHDIFTNTKNKLGSWFWSKAPWARIKILSPARHGETCLCHRLKALPARSHLVAQLPTVPITSSRTQRTHCAPPLPQGPQRGRRSTHTRAVRQRWLV